MQMTDTDSKYSKYLQFDSISQVSQKGYIFDVCEETKDDALENKNSIR